MEEIIKARGEGVLVESRPPAGRGGEGMGRIREEFGTLFVGLWATNEQGGAEGSRDTVFPNI